MNKNSHNNNYDNNLNNNNGDAHNYMFTCSFILFSVVIIKINKTKIKTKNNSGNKT